LGKNRESAAPPIKIGASLNIRGKGELEIKRRNHGNTPLWRGETKAKKKKKKNRETTARCLKREGSLRKESTKKEAKKIQTEMP